AGSPANDIIAMPGSTSDEEIVDLSSDVNESASDWDMDSFTPIEEFEGDEIQTQSDVQAETLEADALELDEFQQVPLTNKRADNTPPPQMAEDDNQWVQKDLSQFQVNENVLFDDSPPVSFDADEEEIEIQNESSISEPRDISENTQKAAHTHASEGLEIESLDDVETFNLFDPPPNFIERRKRPSVSKKDIEEIVTKHIDEALENTIRREAAKIIEDVVWKVVPEITKQIVEKELKRLLEEDDEI
ncbi:MAG: hypothetical protein KDD50_16570, partial [Bdellovibrionales bacterium]|nr:hypothetical protein [Bdellovibrionales bacterium]